MPNKEEQLDKQIKQDDLDLFVKDLLIDGLAKLTAFAYLTGNLQPVRSLVDNYVLTFNKIAKNGDEKNA